MNLTWQWANRSIHAIRALAAQWDVDIWVGGFGDEIDPENKRQFERYENDCLKTLRKGESDFEKMQSGDIDVFGNLFDEWIDSNVYTGTPAWPA